jgi:hypothetical protein
MKRLLLAEPTELGRLREDSCVTDTLDFFLLVVRRVCNDRRLPARVIRPMGIQTVMVPPFLLLSLF